MYPHRIRLRGPWQCEPLGWLTRRPDGSVEELHQPLPAKCRMTMPCRWAEGGLGNFSGRVRFRRRFGLPRQIDAYERVWMTFAGVDSVAAVWLNGQSLGRHEGADEPFEFEISALLQERNEVIVEVEAPDGNGGLWGEVALEIRCMAFLRDVRLWATYSGDKATLHVAGEVTGKTEQPLELYVVLDRFTVGYQTLRGCGPFQIDADELPPERWQLASGEPRRFHDVRVELVNAGISWYTIEQSFEFLPS